MGLRRAQTTDGRKPFLRPVVLLAGLRIKCHATGARRKSQLRARVSDILADGGVGTVRPHEAYVGAGAALGLGDQGGESVLAGR